MKDSSKLGVFIGLGYLIGMPSLGALILGLNIGFIGVGLSYALLLTAFIIPIVMYVKGLRDAMKAYLLTLFVPVLGILLLFGSCMFMLGVK